MERKPLLLEYKGTSCNFPLLNDRHRKWRYIKRDSFAQFRSRKIIDNWSHLKVY